MRRSITWLSLVLALTLGGLAHAQSGTVLNNDPGEAIPTRCVNPAGTAFVDCGGAGGGGGGTSQTDEAGWTAGTTPGTPVMGARDDAASDTLAEDTVGVIRATTNRALHVNLRDASGNELAVGGGTQYDQGTATTDTDKLTMAGCVRADTAAVATGVVDGDRARCIVDATGRLWVHVGVIDGTVSVSGPLTDAQLRATPVPISGTVTVTDGAGALTVDGTVTANQGGAPWSVAGPAADGAAVAGNPVRVGGKDGSGNTQDIATDTSGELQVDVLTLPSVTIGAFPDNEPINVAQMNGVAVTMNNGAAGTGVQRVTLASDSTGNIATIGTSVTPGTAAANLGKAEDAVAGSGDTGVAPLLVREDTPTATAANGDYIHQKGNQYGHAFTAQLCNDSTLTTSVAIAQTALNGNAELVALTTNQTIYVCGYNFISSGTANIRLVYGTGTACATGETGITGAYPLVANTGLVVGHAGAIVTKTAVSNALCIETSASVNVAGMVTYVKGQF